MTSAAPGTIRAAIYLRISLDATGERMAVDRQREDCRKIASGRGWTVVQEYVDNSVSASDKAKRRPAYDQMVADFQSGAFDALVCYDLDRLTRQPRQLEDWIDAAKERGLLLVTANGEADLTTDGGQLFARIKASVARSEVDRKSARQSRALQQRADQGRPPLGVRLTGYTTAGEIDPSEAGAVRAVFTRFVAGDSLRGIAAWLNDESLSTRSGRPWNPSTVRTILLNPRYAGRAVYRGKATGKLGRWEPIVSESQFDAAQAIFTDPRRTTNRVGTDRKHLGSGIFRCGICSGRMRSHSGDRYRCPEGGHVIRSSRPIDNYVTRIVTEWLSRPDFSTLLDTPLDRTEIDKIAPLRARLEQIERDYDDGLIDGRRYSVASEKVQAELVALQASSRRSTAGATAHEIAGAKDPAGAFVGSPLGVRRAIIDEYFSVVLHSAPRGRKTFDVETIDVNLEV